MDVKEQVLLLQKIDVFRSCSDAGLVGIAAACAWSMHDAGDVLIRTGDVSNDILLLLKGTARASVLTARGRRIDFDELDAGEMIGELGAIDGEPRSADVRAVTDCVTARIAGSVLFAEGRLEFPVMMALLKRMARRQRKLTARVHDLNALSVASRVAAELIHHLPHCQDDGGCLIEDCPTQEQLASLVCSDRVGVAKTFVKLIQSGILERGSRRRLLFVHDVQALRRLAQTGFS